MKKILWFICKWTLIVSALFVWGLTLIGFAAGYNNLFEMFYE